MDVKVEVLKRDGGYVAKIGHNIYTKEYEQIYDLLNDLNPNLAEAFMDMCITKLEEIVEENKQ